MAEVTGDIGGQPVQLNNAATEATLKQLLAAMTAMAKAQGLNLNAQKEYEKELKKLAKESEKQAKAAKAKADIDQKAITAEKKRQAQLEASRKAQEKYIESLKDTEKALEMISNVIQGAAGAVTDLTKSAASMGNSATSAAAMFGKIPIVGGLVANVFGGIAEAGEKTYKAFQQASSVGANFGGSINEMIGAASSAGMTIENFTSLVAKNGQNLALLGGSTAEGARRLAKFGNEIRKNTQLNAELANLGYSTEDVNNGLARYSAIMLKSGRSQADVNKNLVAETGEYLKNLDAVSKLTGKNKEALQEEAEARRNDAQFRIAERKLDPQSRKNLELLMQSMSKAEQEAFKGALATGTMNEAMVKLNATSPQVAQEMMKTALAARSSGQLTKDSAIQLDKNMTAAAKAAQNNAQLNVLGAHLADQYGEQVVSTLDRAARTSSLEEQIAKNVAEKEQAQKSGMTPEQMKTFQENLAQLSNRFSQLLAENMPKFMSVMDSVSRILEGPLMSGFTLLIDNLGKVVAGLVALKLAQVAYQTKLKIEQAKAAQRGSSSKDPMYVRDADGGLDRKERRGRRGKTGGKTGGFNPKNLVRGTGLFGAVLGVANLASDLSDISEDEKSGNLTAAQAKEARGGAIGGAAGGAGGAWAGAAAGAALGSVVPIIGTAVGGLLGGAIGYFVGKKSGEVVGKAIAKPTEKLDKTIKTQTQAVKENTEATEKQAAEAKKATEAAAKKIEGPNWTDPNSTLKYFRETMQQPGTTSSQPSAAPTSSAPIATAPINQAVQSNMALVEEAMKKQGLTDPKYIAALKANIMKETGGKSITENMNYGGTSNDRIRKIFGSRAAGKTDAELDMIKKDPSKMGEMMYGSGTQLGRQMGNTEPGDGFKYRGRGFIQLTGKSNYAAASKAIYGDNRLVDNPDLVNDPNVAAQVSAWYMKKGQTSMAGRLGINTANMTQEQANLLATSQIAGGDIRKKGAIGQEILGKVTAYSGQFTGPGGSLPTAVAQTTTTPTPQTVQTTLARPPATTVATTTPAIVPSTTVAQKSVQDPSVSLLASLNSKMDMLIAINQKTSLSAEKQVRVSSVLSADMMVAA